MFDHTLNVTLSDELSLTKWEGYVVERDGELAFIECDVDEYVPSAEDEREVGMFLAL